MIRVGAIIHQTCLCPSCGADCRVFSGSGTQSTTVVCRNSRCKDSDILFVVDRIRGVVTEVETKEAMDEKSGKTHQGR